MKEEESSYKIEAQAEQTEQPSSEISPEQAKQEAFQEVAQLRETINGKIKELVGEGKTALPDFLERAAVRRKLVESGVMTPKAGESLSVAYKEYNGAGLDLSGLKQELGRYTEQHPLGGLREIPDGVIHIEDKAMGVLGDCEVGWATPGAFKNALSEEIDNFKIEQLGKERGLNLSPNEQKKGFAGLQEYISTAKEDMFSRMMSWSGELPGELGRWKQRFEALRNEGKNVNEEFRKMMGDRLISQDLSSALLNFKEQFERGRSDETTEALRIARRAEIVGLTNSTQTLNLERKIER